MIASVGTLSGPIGLTFLPMVETVQAWVQYTNDRGGINGHPIRMLVYDDGADPARHRSMVQDAIENKRVIAFVQNTEGATGRSSVQYVTSRRVPVIGSETSGQWFYKSPMYFPQASHGDHLILGAIAGAAKQLVPKGKTKLGTLVCVEVDTCSRADQLWGENATKFGFELAYRGKASLAQPDYTGECLAARNQGVQAILMTLDPNSIGRIALSCARQGYRPVFATLAAIQVDRMKDDPNLEGMVVTTPVFPYLQAGTPATDEFQKTMRTYGSKVPVGIGQATGWVAAKLFEKAAANLPEPPSSDAVLRGLWSLRDDTLGDLTLPLSFAENQTAPQQTCWFTLALENHVWVSPDQFKRNCL